MLQISACKFVAILLLYNAVLSKSLHTTQIANVTDPDFLVTADSLVVLSFY